MDANAWKNSVEWERYQARLKFQRDQNMYVNDAREEGIRLGREEGRKEERETVLKEAAVDNIHLCQRLLKTPMAPREDLLSMTLDELKAMVAELEKLLGVANQ